MDPFAVLGLAPDLDLDRDVLESRYLELSRACHPDHHGGADADAQVALLTRAAAVNDAYRVLRDPWRRAEALVEVRAPGALRAAHKLPPAFLTAALELAEEVAGVTPGSEAATALRARVAAALAADFAAVRGAVAAADWVAAATRLQQARYHRKALHDLGP